MPAATVTITPGYLPPDGTPITCAILRQIAQPSATANFSIPPATLNFITNGNFNKTLWTNLTGLTIDSVNGTSLMQLQNASGWTAQAVATGAGKALTVLPSTDTPNQQSYYSMEIDATSASFTALGFFTQIPSDVSAVLEGQQVTISFWIKNLQSGTFTPAANFISPNTQDAFSGPMTNIATTALQTVSQGVWTKMSATVTLSNALINNGLQLEIDFPLASLTALAGGLVQFRFSQMFLQIGNVSTAFQSDPSLIADIFSPPQARILFGPTGSVVSTMNGDMQIWQRNTTFAAVGNAFKVSDRFQGVVSMGVGVATVAQQAIELPAIANQYPHTKYSTRVTVTTLQASMAAGNFFGISQRIERQFARALFDGTSSLSIVLQSSIVGVFSVAIRSATSADSIVYECPVGVINTPYRFTFPAIPAMPVTTPATHWGTADTDFAYEIDIMCACGSTFMAPALGAWQAGNYMASANQANLFAVNGSTLDITLLQHEAGPVCTPYLYSPFSSAIRECGRYFQKSYTYGSFLSANQPTGYSVFTASSTAAAYGGDSFRVEMRSITPTMLICTNDGAFLGDVTNLTAGTNVGGGLVVAGATSKKIYNTSATGVFVVGNIYACHWTADAEL
jgi:hypothetical protein